jgi:hypothetical protein
MGGDIGILALGVGMEVVVGIFLLVSWSAISVMIAGLAFLFSSLPFECLFLVLMYTSVALCEFPPHICFYSSSFFLSVNVFNYMHVIISLISLWIRCK